MIFCLPLNELDVIPRRVGGGLTVAAGLDGGLNVADALDGDAVLVVAIDILVLKLTNLVNENTKLVGDIRDIVVASLAPDGELLLKEV